MKQIVLAFAIAAALITSIARATETENLGMRILPAPGKVVVDGKIDDWDLSGGIFACGDAEKAAGQYAVWFHAMYDKENLYLLARWIDPTPMNNPGSIKGDYGFNGDCLQVRIVTAPDVTAKEVADVYSKQPDASTMRTTHMTAWRDRDKLDIIDLAYGRTFKDGGVKDAKSEGAAQAFLENDDHKGYVQELSIPWTLLNKTGIELKAGSRIMMTLEPNFVVGTGGRLTIKDLFKAGVAIDRVFTFQGSLCWGYATLEAQGHITPRPVRLADGREFPVHMENNIPVVDWTGLIKSKMPDGFKPIHISLPEDAHVSLNIFAPDGTVARQLLTNHFLTKGEHDIQWDGLTMMSVRRPGTPLPAGAYTWEGFYHSGIGLKLLGWAGNSGSAPWRGWGADHGNPKACAAAGNMIFAGWGAGEGDKPLLACDTAGTIKWKNIRGGIAGASLIATDGATVYAFNDVGGYAQKAIYRVTANSGQYTEWSALKSTDLTMKDIWGDEADIPEGPSGLAAASGKVFVSFSSKDAVMVIDAKTGKVIKKISVPKPSSVAAASAAKIFVVTNGRDAAAVDVEKGESQPFASPALEGTDWTSALALDKSGNLYMGIRGANQVLVIGADGKLARTIGRKGGRALSGPWTPDGMLNISGLAVDGTGRLWVAEDDGTPKRVSVWDAATGAFKFEMFGSASYGATGACIDPLDPNLVVGQGCEWRIDPKTGKSVCLGTITRDGMGASRFGFGPNNKLYLAVTPTFLHGDGPVTIYERLGDANYKPRARIRRVEKDGAEKGKKSRVVEVWSDANDDGIEQPDEIKSYAMDLGGWINGWYMPMTPDLTFYGSLFPLKVTGWTACGAPLYDVAQAAKLPGPTNAHQRGGMGAQHGHGSVDGRFMLWNGGYGEDHSTFDCYDIATGKALWTYPNNFTGVHGSHRACSPEVGMIRGAYDICGAAKLPPPIGNIWVIPTNKGEWHVVTERGFYLTQLWQSDPTQVTFPDQAVPGVSLDSCPPGSGEEAFGGSITQGLDGKLYVQAGHISYWDAEVTGLDSIRALPGGKIEFTAADAQQAGTFRAKYLQEATKAKHLVIAKATPVFTGDLDTDFAGIESAKYEKEKATAIRTALAYDDQFLYAAWEVKDSTPWVNGADAPEFMYTRGDAVDLQIASNPKAPKDRREAILGDMRISIGPFQNKPVVMIYRKVTAGEKHPKSFNSGVQKNYVMESVLEMKDAKVEVKIDKVNKRYIVEAALPLAALELKLTPGLVLQGDFGAMHSNKEGNDTVLRTFWSNQNTGLVSDEVFELQMTPNAWGELEFK